MSYNLQQFFDLTDRFVTLRLGELAVLGDRAASTVDQIVQLIVYGAPLNAGARQ